MEHGKASVLLAFLNHQKSLLKENNTYFNEMKEKEESPRILSDEEYFEQKNPSKGNELLKLIKRKLG